MSKITTTRKTKTTENPTAELEARLASLREQERELAAKLKLARGTGDHTEVALRVGGELSMTLDQRIEAILRDKPHSLDELTRELKEPAGRISSVMKTMRKRLYNVGTEDAPVWFYIVGDEASAEQINNAVRALISFRPMRFPELLTATGARQGRVSGAIVAMQRDPKSRIANVDPDRPQRARWFIVPEGVQIARLKSR